MAEWSNDASEYLDAYLKQVTVLIRGQGGDPSDVVDGLRDHVLNELEGAASVSMDELLRVLNDLGSPEEVVNLDPIPKGRPVVGGPTPPPPAPLPSKKSKTVVVHRSPASCAVAGCLIAIGGVVGLAVLSIVASILVPALSRARMEAREVSCRENLQVLHAGLAEYAAAHDGQLPVVDLNYRGIMFDIDTLFPEILSDLSVLVCPNGPNPDLGTSDADSEYSYDYDYVYFSHVVMHDGEAMAYLDAVAEAKRNDAPLTDAIALEDGSVLERIEMAERIGGLPAKNIPLLVERTNRHGWNRFNVLFLDGHVESGSFDQDRGFIWTQGFVDAVEERVGNSTSSSRAVEVIEPDEQH